MEAFGQSVYARYAQHFGGDAEVPADGYHGDYVRDEAVALADTLGDTLLAQNADGGGRPARALGDGAHDGLVTVPTWMHWALSSTCGSMSRRSSTAAT